MDILHVCSYFNTSKLYKNLFTNLEKLGINQTVFIPMYNKHEQLEYSTVREREKDTKFIDYHYIPFLYEVDRYFLLYRSYKTYNRMKEVIDMDDYHLIHAHSFFYNGLVAYKAKREFGIKYIVAFRATDLQVFDKAPHYRFLVRRIIDGASKVVFISKSLYQKFEKRLKKYDSELRNQLEQKSVIIPNGVERYHWDLANFRSKKGITDEKKEYVFLYQGSFLPRKKVLYSMELLDEIATKGYKIKMNIYGDGPDKNKIEKKAKTVSYPVKIGNWSHSKEEIASRYNSADFFIMPSVGETFGISYVEAMVYGNRVICAKHEGVDGMFPNDRVLAISLNKEKDVKKIIDFISNKSDNCQREYLEKYSWKSIALNYQKEYEDLN